jgi:predicted phage tail protein
MNFHPAFFAAALRGIKRYSTLILMLSVALVAAVACYLTSGMAGMERAVVSTATQMPWLFARIGCALILAGFVQMLPAKQKAHEVGRRDRLNLVP